MGETCKKHAAKKSESVEIYKHMQKYQGYNNFSVKYLMILISFLLNKRTTN